MSERSGFRRLDNFDRSAVLGSGFDDQGGGADESLELGLFFQNDGTGARKLAANIAVDVGAGRRDGIEKFDSRAAFDAQFAAFHFAEDFSVAADDEVAGAIDRPGKRSEHGQVMALDRSRGDGAGF